MKYLVKNIISETENTLINLAENATSMLEIEKLLSFFEYRYLQDKLWDNNHLNSDFIKLWLLHYDNSQMPSKAYCLNDILLRPIYDIPKETRLWCGFISDDWSHNVVLRKYYCELRDSECYIDLNKTSRSDRLYFEIDELATNFKYLTTPSLSVYRGIITFPKHDYYEFQRFIITLDDIKKLKNVSHPQIVNANIAFRGSQHFYSKEIRIKAVEMCKDKECLKILLSDADSSIAEAAKTKLLKLNFTKREVDKMLADTNENVRIVGLQILHDMNL